MEAGGPLGTSNASPSGQFLSAPCLAQRTFAVYFASHHPTQPLGSKITQHYDFPRADCRLNLKRDKPILTHSACPLPMPPRHLWHPGSCLTGWLESESNKRDTVLWPSAQHLSQPGTHRHRTYLSNGCVIHCWPLRWTSSFSTTLWSPMCKSQKTGLV